MPDQSYSQNNYQQPIQPPVNQIPIYPGMSKKKKILIISIIGAAIVLLIIIISIILMIVTAKPKPAPQPIEKQPVTLVIWSSTENAAHYQKLIDDYHTQNTLITVKFEQRDPATYKQTVEERLRSSNQNFADIFEVNNRDIFMYSNGSALSPAPTSVFRSTDFDKYFAQIQTDNVLMNSVYGVPTGIDGLMLAYNTDLVKSTDLRTFWSEFANVVETKTVTNPKENSRNTTNGISFSDTTKTKYLDEILQLLFFQNNQKDNSLYPVFDTKLSVDALNIYKSIISKYPWDENEEDSIQAFINGHTAFAVIKASDIYTIQSQNPSLKFKTTTIPIIATQTYWASYTSFVVSSKSSNPTESWNFLKYISSEDSLKYLYDSANSFKLSKKPFPLLSMALLLKNDELLAPIGTMSPNMISLITPDRDKTTAAFINIIQGTGEASKNVIQELNGKLQQIIPSFP